MRKASADNLQKNTARWSTSLISTCNVFLSTLSIISGVETYSSKTQARIASSCIRSPLENKKITRIYCSLVPMLMSVFCRTHRCIFCGIYFCSRRRLAVRVNRILYRRLRPTFLQNWYLFLRTRRRCSLIRQEFFGSSCRLLCLKTKFVRFFSFQHHTLSRVDYLQKNTTTCSSSFNILSNIFVLTSSILPGISSVLSSFSHDNTSSSSSRSPTIRVNNMSF